MWLVNGKPLNNEDISISSVGRRGSVLSIESVQYEHAGNYTCLARNGAGKTEYTSELQVNGYLFLELFPL